MKKSDIAENPTILEAVDNLSSMVELDLEELQRDKKGSQERSLLRLKTSNWLDPQDEHKTVESVKGTFRAVHNYLKYIYSKENEQLKDKEMQKGVRSIITLATEAAAKIEHYIGAIQSKEQIVQSKEFQDLIDFYQKKILKQFEESLETEESWKEEWEREEDAADIQRRGLKDLETVTRDRDYELFYITKEDGSRFYNKNLIRHIRLVTDFDQILGNLASEDPLLKVKRLQDKETHETARLIKGHLVKQFNIWLKTAGKYRDDPFAKVVYRMMMALLLASNPRNCLTQTTSKTASAYFKDFQINLRSALNNIDYQSFIQNSNQDIDAFYDQTVGMLHEICYYLFVNSVDESDAFAFFTKIIGQSESAIEKEEGDKQVKPMSKSSSIALWNRILDSYELLQKELKAHPSGPLFKVLDILQEARNDTVFDPYMQDDRADALYRIHFGSKEIPVLRLPCPTSQHSIEKAKILEEFQGCMRHIIKKQQKLLIINFQDRTSWKEFARSSLLESFQKEAEVRKNLDVITLPKNSDFYLQSDEYIKLNDAKEFKKLVLEQIKSEEACGFYFPKHVNRSELHQFVEASLDFIHTVFLGKKEQLSRKNRLDVIEMLYYLLILKSMQLLNVDILAFSAKDGIDIPSTVSAGFYAFIKMLSKKPDWKEEEKDVLLRMIFLPALLIRERIIEVQQLNRMVSMLALLSAELEVNQKLVMKGLTELYTSTYLKELTVEPFIVV